MSAVSAESGAFTLTLTEEERSLLLNFLEQGFRDKQIEEHRTDALTYKEHLQHQEALLRGLIDKLRRA
jgi:hypothetical protein